MTLKRKLKELNENVSGDKNALWLRLFSKILDQSLEAESQGCDSQKEGAISTESITGGFVMSHNANGEPDIIGNVETNANGVDDLSEPIDVDTLESKKETYIWNKGAWLSYCGNIKS